MIRIGIDDTDTIETRGTNAIARELVARLGFDRNGRRARVLRHQLLDDPRVPYTSKNGSASIILEEAAAADAPEITGQIKKLMLEWFIEGSDPGLCVSAEVPAEVVAFALRCKHELIEQREAREIAARHGIHLEGLGGTEGGVIGALAAIGLESTGDDGRIVHLGGWPWPDDVRGIVDVRAILDRGVEEVRVATTGERVTTGSIDIEKRLRPNWRGGKVVLFVDASPGGAQAPFRALRPT